MPHNQTTNYDMIGGNGSEYGSVTADQIRRWISERRANKETLIRRSGENDWKTISSFEEFITSFPELYESKVSPIENVFEIVKPIEDFRPIEPFSVVGCLGSARDLLNKNFLPIAGACLTIWSLTMALNFIPILGPFIILLLIGPVHGALFRMVLDRKRGQETTFLQAWADSKTQRVTLMIAGASATILTSLGYLFVLPGLYLTIAWTFGLLIILDQNTNAWVGLENSRRSITSSFLGLASLLSICYLPLIVVSLYGGIQFATEAMKIIGTGSLASAFTNDNLQLLANKVGSIALIVEIVRLLVMPLATCVIVVAYERLNGSTSDPTK